MSKKITAEFELKTGKTKDELEDVVKGVDGIKKGLKDTANEGKKTNKILKGISNLFKGALGLGIVIKAFDILKETFMANQKVADTFATVMETISLVFNQVVNAVVKGNGEFNALGKVLTNVLNIGLAPFKLAFEGISIAIMSAQKAFLEFTGGSKERIAELTLGIIEAKAAVVDIGSGVVDSGKAIVENFGAAVNSIKEISISAAYETAKANVELQKSAEVAAVINQGLIEKYDRQAEQQRQIRDDESKTIEERIEANNKLGEVLEEQQKLMLENVDLQIKSAQAQYDKNASQENYIALLEAQNEREAVLAQIEGFRSEQLINRISLEKELSDTVKEGQEAEAERINDLLEKKLEAAKIEADLKKQQVEAAKEQDKQTLNNLIAVVGEGSKVGKAAAVAQATISGIEGVQNAYTTAQSSPITALFPAYPIIQAGLAAAFSGKQIQSILSVDERGGGGSVSAPSGGGSQAPSFNVVGAAPENQLAQAIGEKEDKPMKAYVVSNEVSNAQALDRNIVEGASIG